MPFKSEKQRRYLWANEPEIARDWTDTYGSGIHKALGGRIGFAQGSHPRKLKQRFIEVIQLMQEASGQELAALAQEARVLKDQIRELERAEPSVGQGIRAISKGLRMDAPELLASKIQEEVSPGSGYKTYAPGYGREKVFPGLQDETITIDKLVGINPNREMIAASMRISPENIEKWKERLQGNIYRGDPRGWEKGGRIGFYKGSDRHAGTGSSQSQAPEGGAHRGPSPDRDGPAHLSHNAPQAPYQDRIQNIAAQNKRTTDLRNRAGGEGFHQFLNKPPVRPNVGGGIKNFLGNWASTVGGSQLGGGLGSMLLGPWGMLLGTIFGGGAGRRAWKAGQTEEKETIRDILFGNPNIKSTLLSNLFNKKTTPRDEGLGAIDLSNMDYDKRHFQYPFQKSYSELDTIPVDKYKGLQIQRNYQGEPIGSDLVQEVRLTDVQKKGLDAKKNHYKRGLIDADQVWDSIKPWDDPEDPSTKQEVIEYLKT